MAKTCTLNRVDSVFSRFVVLGHVKLVVRITNHEFMVSIQTEAKVQLKLNLEVRHSHNYSTLYCQEPRLNRKPVNTKKIAILAFFNVTTSTIQAVSLQTVIIRT